MQPAVSVISCYKPFWKSAGDCPLVMSEEADFQNGL